MRSLNGPSVARIRGDEASERPLSPLRKCVVDVVFVVQIEAKIEKMDRVDRVDRMDRMDRRFSCRHIGLFRGSSRPVEWITWTAWTTTGFPGDI